MKGYVQMYSTISEKLRRTTIGKIAQCSLENVI